MADMIRDAVEYLNTVREAQMGQSVTYKRGATSVSATATPVHDTFGASMPDGIVLEVTATEFIIGRAMFDDNSLGEPKRGDTIEWTHDGSTYTFEVTSDGSDAYENHDAYGYAYLIHAKLVNVA